MRKRLKRKSGGNPKGKSAPPYPFEFKLKQVRLHLEDGYAVAMLSQEFGVSGYSLYRWVRLYREHGEAGLLPKGRSKPAQRLSESVQEKIVEIKKAHPQSDSRRISDVLRRFFLIKASASSVHKTLSQEGLTTPPKRKPPKNPAKPRFFERARPNQLWQSDIMTYRLAGRNAYLIGFMDDYSRFYMVGRMGEKSVVIRAEKGQVKMLVDDAVQPPEKELVYDARKDIDDEESKRVRRSFAPQQKITAVLSVWTERRTTAEMCRELSVSPALLNQWQTQAMEGMLTALSPKRAEQQPVLNARLTRLIEKSLPDPTAKLQKRLKAIEKSQST
jgi:transposase-like protein